MSRRNMIHVELVDVNGSVRRFFDRAPREVREVLTDAVKKTAFAMSRRMTATAPVGPEAPHIREAISYKARGLTARAGILEDEGSKPAAPGSDTTQAEVALYNEYDPNRQPFIGPAGNAEANDFALRCIQGLRRAERSLSSGVGI